MAGFEFRFQATAGNVLHREVGRTGVLVHFVDADNVGVAELGDGLGLALETLAVGLPVAVVVADQLERHDPPDGELPRFVNFGHAAAAKQREDFVVAVVTDPVARRELGRIMRGRLFR